MKRPPLPSGVKISDVRHPGGMSAEQNSGCKTSGWNVRCHMSQGGRLRVQGVGTPPPDDTECASLSGSTPSEFPKREAHGTREHHTPDDSISYPDMLSRSLTKVSKPCYVIPPACYSPCSAAFLWCVRTPCPNIFAMDSKELSLISDYFGDKKAIKTPKLNTI